MASTTLAEDRFGRAIQALGLGASQDLAFTSGASAASVALSGDCQAVRVLADQDCRIAIGVLGSTTASATGARLSAGIPEVFRVPVEATQVAARGVTTSGSLNIVELV